ncbi:hypothetical protein [Microbacterium sp. A84]|uniref:hypothetical protein n=1 Tax=Microbacterium sp. A84 TaxID=3450715 RepID=UPI003F420F83
MNENLVATVEEIIDELPENWEAYFDGGTLELTAPNFDQFSLDAFDDEAEDVVERLESEVADLLAEFDGYQKLHFGETGVLEGSDGRGWEVTGYELTTVELEVNAEFDSKDQLIHEVARWARASELSDEVADSEQHATDIEEELGSLEYDAANLLHFLSDDEHDEETIAVAVQAAEDAVKLRS